MTPKSNLRPPVSTREVLALSAFLATGTTLAADAPAQPEQKKDDKKQEGEAQSLGDMVVEAVRQSLYKPEKLQTTKYTVPLRDVPQTVTVVPKEVMKEQGSTSLRDVLKNVPGITMQAGEGGVPNGDNLSIRGFNARTDLFVDGVRDFGGYSRDPFNLESVEVSKGPSSSNSGRGSTGGSVNLASKTPHLDKNAYELMLGGGSDNYGRTTFDVNQAIPQIQGAAFRVNGMYHTQDTPGRDHVDQERWGIAPSIAFGLDTETRWTLSYFYLGQDNTPDNGLPWVPRTSNNTGLTPGIPAVDFNNWYGVLNRDYEKIATHMATSVFEHDFNEKLKFRNTTRFGITDRDSITTSPRFDNTPPYPSATVRRTDWKTRDQVDTILTNVAELRYDFETGPFKHELLGGFEVTRETSKNYNRVDANAGLLQDTNLYYPSPYIPGYSPAIYRDGAGTDVTSDTVALYAFDTIKFGEQWMLSGGVRYEDFSTDYLSTTAAHAYTALSREDQMYSWRAALTYKPCDNGSIYLGYGTSFNPSAEGLTLANTATATNSINTDPEKSNTVELGTKWDLFDKKLLLTAAIFQTDKTNARTEDPTNNGDVVVLDGEQRVRGFEIGATGEITKTWRVIGGYTYLDSEITKSKNKLEVGNQLMNTPENSFNIWSTHDLPKGFTIGYGAQYTGERFNNNNRSTRQLAPDFTTFDAMLSYKVNDNVTLRLNGYNLADKEYIDRLSGGHFVPGTGRSVVLSSTFTF
ncbi:TonB-dependent siderophore receptor [Luteolibacter sp. LG18]|uniref:TonB-dependent receptor n=1 Tax=Luteolibacter sp. LG18 TaxID=2819286 RepID=UPI002B2A87AB|nr:iron transport outer membrane receptor [Luteolibacter sp. LG18]